MVARDGYELIVGSSLDAQFGPILLFGAGGQLVEVFKDRALGLPPLNSTLARRMMEQTKIFTALSRGSRPAAGGRGCARATYSFVLAIWSSSNAGSRRLTSIPCLRRRNGFWRSTRG